MNDLETYFNQNTERVILKWPHYFEVYERHFSKYRNKDIVLLEIGTFNGGSLQMWKNYFGDRAKIYGIDINPNCKQVEEENITILIGSQSDRNFLKKVKEEIPPIDILIDDGGHTMLQQIVSFEELFSHVKPDGVYLCEDMHTSYWVRFGGGFKRRGTFVEYSKKFIDYLNAYHAEKSLKVNSFTESVNSLHYYDSILVIEKRPTPKPYTAKTGTITIPYAEEEMKGLELFFKKKLNYKVTYALNRFLAFFRLPLKNGDFYNK
jgi:cephalosporin hydroxylase